MDSDIPDLDDMSDLVEKIKLNKKSNKHSYQSQTSTSKEKTISTHDKGDIAKETAPVKPACRGGKKDFGGMKKGFLFGSKESKPKKNVKKLQTPQTVEVMEVVKPKLDRKSNDHLVLDEVQEAMKQDEGPFKTKDWLTDDLLKNVEANPKLCQQLANPHFEKALEWMKRDPKGAMEYYKNDLEVQEFFKEFYQLLGNHFVNIGDKQADLKSKQQQEVENLNQEDKKALDGILSNPDIRSILAKEQTQNLLHLLRTDPEEAQKFMVQSDSSFKADVQKLVSAGVLAFQSQ